MPDSLKLMIQSGNRLIAIESPDEERAIEQVVQVATELDRPLFDWSMTTGLRQRRSSGFTEPIVEPEKFRPALSKVMETGMPAVFLMRDAGAHCKDAMVHRLLRDVSAGHTKSDVALVLVESLPLPPEIRRFIVRYELAWPTSEELEQTIRQAFKRIRGEHQSKISARVTRRDMDQLIQTFRGLTCTEAERVFAAAIFDDDALTAEDLPRIMEGKRTLLGTSGCLEAIAPNVSPDDIGGLATLKTWLKQRRGGFTREAREFGLEPPRGVLMLGVPGCGKSLCAKVIACDWKMPLMRLDPGVLYQKFIGESESQLRQALAQAEAMAPVVLWIDEIEKAFASAASSSADGGLSRRMFGTLLTWMQDHRHPIFIIATANDISALPPELMRKGRFDEIFFIDLPTSAVRARILEIHLAKRKRDPRQFDAPVLAEAAEGYSGAELEQAVVSALFLAYSERKELTNAHLLEAIRKTHPLSVLLGEQVRELRDWSRNRCVPAD